jgi:tRNA1Val (adenine37-N6)-methyltransferase
VQKGPCRFEHRGGVEDYTAAAARALAPQGRFALCAAYGQQERIEAAAALHDLVIVRRVDVVPRAGKAPLLVLDVLERRGAGGAAAPTLRHDSITVRDEHGQWTPAFQGVRAAMGLPPPMR